MKHDIDQFRRDARAQIYAGCRENLFAFFRLAFPILAPTVKFCDAKHMRVLCTAFEGSVRGERPRLCVCIPPRHGKSIIGSVLLPAWILGRNPAAKIICGSYGDQLAKDFSTRCRDLIQSDVCRNVFPETVLESATLDELRTSEKGYRWSTSVGGVVTGKGADYIILDDPMKAADAHSEAARNTVFDWVKNGLMSRFDNTQKGVLIVIMQRLHQDDLIGRLRDEGGFTILEMPGECLVPQDFELGGGDIWHFRPGDYLYPEQFGAAAHAQLRLDLGELGYNAQILQRPTPPGGAIFKLKHFQRYEQLPHFEKIEQSWDVASTEEDYSAWTVCTTWGIRREKLYLIDVFRKRMKFHQLAPAMLSLRDKFQANVVILETIGVGHDLGDILTSQDRNWRTWLVGSNPKTDKVTRAIAQTPMLEQKRIYLPTQAPWLETYEREIAEFPLGKFDDQVDSTVQFLRSLRTNHTIVTRGLSAYPPRG